MPGCRKGLGGIVASGAGNAQTLAFGLLGNRFGYLVVFIPRENRAFTGGSDGQNAGDAVLNLKISQFFQAFVVNGIVFKWSDDCGIASCFHDYPLYLKPIQAVILKYLYLPKTPPPRKHEIKKARNLYCFLFVSSFFRAFVVNFFHFFGSALLGS